MTVALICGKGDLPAALARSMDKVFVAALDGFAPSGLMADVTFRVERLVPFLDDLLDRGISDVVFAGAVSRPILDPALVDAKTAHILPGLIDAMAQGDDATLRAVIAVFEDFGLRVLGVADVAPALCPSEALFCGVPTAQNARDADRAAVIVDALGAVDVGQAAVVNCGICLGVEVISGTDHMLQHVALLQQKGGVLWKATKPEQDLRIDLPTLGVATVDAVARAGLDGIAWQADSVICLDLPEMIRRATAQGLFLWAR